MAAFDPSTRRHAFGRLTHSWLGVRLSLAVAAVVTLLALVNVLALEIGPLGGRAIQVDETFFATCAMRGVAVGQVPVAGCHDNKGPVILQLYEALQSVDQRYPVVKIKCAAYVTVAIFIGLAAWLSSRVAGRVAALTTAILMMQVFAAQGLFMAFKTDIVGGALLLLGLALLEGGVRAGVWRALAAGLAFGFAMMTKQTFEIGAFGAAIWLLWQGWSSRQLPKACARAGLVLVCSILPLVAYALWFYHAGFAEDFFASMFVYPAIYGSGSPLATFPDFLRRVLTLAGLIGEEPLPFVLAGVSLVGALVYRNVLPVQNESRDRSGVSLLWVLSALMTLMYMLSPVLLSYHLVPLTCLAAILGGIGVRDLFQNESATQQKAATLIAVAFAIGATLAAGTSWRTNGGRGRVEEVLSRTETLPDVTPGYAYVLGAWPEFYFYNQLIPASDIMYPWALPGVPEATNRFSSPRKGTWRADLLSQLQQRNVRRLYADFQRTPPRYILVVDEQARHAKVSVNVTDVPGFDDYLSKNCQFSRRWSDGERTALRSLYVCNAPDKIGSAVTL